MISFIDLPVNCLKKLKVNEKILKSKSKDLIQIDDNDHFEPDYQLGE